MKKVSCIIPTYNEEARIGNVLKAVAGHPLIDEIIVVDDGSSDNTQKVVKEFQNIRLIVHPKNKGKSAAVCTGLQESTGEFIFLLDADLIGLTADNITSSIEPVLADVADMSISLRKNTPAAWRMIGLDYISGERVLPRKILIENIKQIGSLSGFGLEVFINKLIIKEKYRIKVVLWNNVDSPYKSKKHGFWAGVKGEIKMMRDIFKTITPMEAVQQILKMLKLRVRLPKKMQNQELKISLIIPAYNEEKYIGACLEHAIKNSAGKFFEIIVIDNASTDKTAEIAGKYPGVRVVREEKKGITRARDRGFRESSGNILANIDADTRMPAGWCEKIISEFEKDDKLVCLSGPYIYYDLPAWQSFLVKIYWLLAVPIYWIIGYMAVGGNFVIKRDTLEKMNGYDTNIEFFGEDTNTARRASKYGKVKFTLSFPMYTSGRRLLEGGLFKTGIVYIAQLFSEVIIHKPATQKYKDIR